MSKRSRRLQKLLRRPAPVETIPRDLMFYLETFRVILRHNEAAELAGVLIAPALKAGDWDTAGTRARDVLGHLGAASIQAYLLSETVPESLAGVHAMAMKGLNTEREGILAMVAGCRQHEVSGIVRAAKEYAAGMAQLGAANDELIRLISQPAALDA